MPFYTNSLFKYETGCVRISILSENVLYLIKNLFAIVPKNIYSGVVKYSTNEI